MFTFDKIIKRKSGQRINLRRKHFIRQLQLIHLLMFDIPV